MPDKRIHAYYEGTVQGVGFRLAAERMALSLRLKGWVKNLEDGRVEVVCEGKEQDLNSFLEKISANFKEYIRDVDLRREDANGEFEGFDIRFD